MKKEIITAQYPNPPLNNWKDLKILTPHPGAADRLGVPHNSLKGVALQLLKSHGYDVASSADAMKTLTGVIQELLPEVDSSSMASSFMLPLQTVLRTGIDLQKLKEYGSQRVTRLAQIAEKYQFELRKKGLVDPEEVLWFASQLPIRPRKLLIYGYHRARFEEINLLKLLAGDGSILYLPTGENSIFKTNQTEIESLKKDGWTAVDTTRDFLADGNYLETPGYKLSQKFVGNPITAFEHKVTAFEYADVEAEARGVLARVKGLVLAGASPKEIVLVSRDASIYGQSISAVAWEYGISVQLMYQVPLSETRFGSWMNLLMDCIDNDFPFDTTVRLLFHPLGQKLPENVWEKVKKQRPQSLEAWLKTGVDFVSLALPAVQSRRDWIKELFSILQVLGVRRKVGIWARELIAFQNFQNELQQTKEDLNAVITKKEFFREVVVTLSLLTAPFQPASGGVEFHEPHTLLGANYKHVFVLGMAEGILPGAVSDNPIVDFYERRRLADFGIHFEDAAAVTRWEALSFYFLLIVATAEISFSYPRLISGSEQIPSPFFARLGLNIQKAHTQIASSLEELRCIELRSLSGSADKLYQTIRHALKVEQLRESADALDEYDGVIGIPLDPLAHTWSASQLTAIGQCAFKWFASKVLRLKTPAAIETDLSVQTRGRLYHKTLELALKDACRSDDPRRAALENLERAFHEAEFDSEIGVTKLTAWEAQRLEHLDVLRRAIESPDFIQPGAQIKETEFSFESVWCGLKLKGQIDRIDVMPDGKITVIDYKTGGSVPAGVKDDNGKPKTDIQIPIYIESAIPELLKGEKAPPPSLEQNNGYYYSISKAKILKQVEGDQLETIHQFADKVKKHLIEGDYSVDPDAEETACRYCDFDSVCRKGYRLIRKRK